MYVFSVLGFYNHVNLFNIPCNLAKLIYSFFQIAFCLASVNLMVYCFGLLRFSIHVVLGFVDGFKVR